MFPCEAPNSAGTTVVWGCTWGWGTRSQASRPTWPTAAAPGAHGRSRSQGRRTGPTAHPGLPGPAERRLGTPWDPALPPHPAQQQRPGHPDGCQRLCGRVFRDQVVPCRFRAAPSLLVGGTAAPPKDSGLWTATGRHYRPLSSGWDWHGVPHVMCPGLQPVTGHRSSSGSGTGTRRWGQGVQLPLAGRAGMGPGGRDTLRGCRTPSPGPGATQDAALAREPLRPGGHRSLAEA